MALDTVLTIAVLVLGLFLWPQMTFTKCRSWPKPVIHGLNRLTMPHAPGTAPSQPRKDTVKQQHPGARVYQRLAYDAVVSFVAAARYRGYQKPGAKRHRRCIRCLRYLVHQSVLVVHVLSLSICLKT